MFTLLSSWYCHGEHLLGSSDECRTVPGCCQRLDLANQLKPQICLSQQLKWCIHLPSPFVIYYYQARKPIPIHHPTKVWVKPVAGYIPWCFICLQTVTHSGINQVWQRVLSETSGLPLHCIDMLHVFFSLSVSLHLSLCVCVCSNRSVGENVKPGPRPTHHCRAGAGTPVHAAVRWPGRWTDVTALRSVLRGTGLGHRRLEKSVSSPVFHFYILHHLVVISNC